MIKKYLTLLLTVFIASTALHGQTLENIKIDNKLSILNDRAFFLFPTDAVYEARATNIMSPDPNINEETRIIFDNGDMRLVFFAQELYTLADNNLFQFVSEQNKQNAIKTKILTDREGMLSILSIPTEYDTTEEAILLNNLIVKTEDNTLFTITAYINSSAYKIKEEYQKLTETVFGTLTKGTRIMDRSARKETHKIFGTEKSLTFSLPANYCVTVDQKFDFQVFNLHKYRTITEPNWVQIVIYNGRHPSLVHEEFGLSKNSGQKIKGKFLKQKLDWLFFYMSEYDVYIKEQTVTCDNVAEGATFHIAMLSNNKELIEEITKIVEKIKVTK